jgi:hypothetical protein
VVSFAISLVQVVSSVKNSGDRGDGGCGVGDLG